MRSIGIIIFVAALVAVLALVFSIRATKHIPEVWHVDPLTAPDVTTPNTYRVAPPDLVQARLDEPARIYNANPALLAEEFDRFVLNEPEAFRIAGTPESGWITYVQRSEVMKFPDYISVLFIDLGQGKSTIALFSRSRFGYGDMGVNKARVERWLGALKPYEE